MERKIKNEVKKEKKLLMKERYKIIEREKDRKISEELMKDRKRKER